MKPWGGRFTKKTDAGVEDFTASLPFDRRLYREDIAGSLAHVRMLAACGIIPPEEAETIVNGLAAVQDDLASERADAVLATVGSDAEDIHMAVERLLAAKIGPVALKLHTARSRNDQVALDERLYLRREIDEVRAEIAGLQRALVTVAERHADAVMPGYTHLQRAQPILLAHHLLAYFEMLQRDDARFRDCQARANVSPLGAGALAGAGFPVDRDFVAAQLGFSGITANSLDAVGDRDFILEFLSDAAILMMHLSRLGEEIVLWSTAEFGFITLDDAYATGSSIMPQKKNPDVAELIRGKTGRVYGDLIAVLTMMKGLPLAYNRDMQEDKEPLFDAVDTIKASLKTMAGLVSTMRVNTENMRRAASGRFITATDAADYLARKGMPFRQAHETVGRIVLWCEKHGRELESLSASEWASFSPLFDADIVPSVRVEASLARRSCDGGTAPRKVAEALKRARACLDALEKRADARETNAGGV